MSSILPSGTEVSAGDPSVGESQQVPLDFIRQYTSDDGASVFLAALRAGMPFWRPLLSVSLAKKLATSPALAREFFCVVLSLENVSIAEEAVRGVLAKLPTEERPEIFSSSAFLDGSSAFHTAMLIAHARDGNWSTSFPKTQPVNRYAAEMLIRVALENKAKTTQKVVYKMTLGGVDKVSPLVSCMIERNAGAARAYVDLGHKFGRIEYSKVLEALSKNDFHSVELMDVVLECVDVDRTQLDHALKLWSHRPEVATAFNAALSRKAIAGVIAGCRNSVRTPGRP